MNNTGIEWADTTWNPVTGCTPISEGCRNCYAARMATRLRGRFGYPADNPFTVTLHPNRLHGPLSARKPRRIFVCSMGDLFHDDVPFDFIDKVFAVMALAEHHQFIVLTKRPARMKGYTGWRSREPTSAGKYDRGQKIDASGHIKKHLCGFTRYQWPLPNVELGVTVETQKIADERIPLLLQCPAAVRFASYEPALELVDFGPWLAQRENVGLDGIIAGGETGPHARLVNTDWFRKVRDDCATAGVPFFFKRRGGREMSRLLDGRLHNQLPGGEK